MPNLSIPYIQVENSRKITGIIAKNFYGNPSKDKIVIGITGTNGKTTTSYYLKHLLEGCGKSCSLIGTIENIINGNIYKANNTTPSSLQLQKLLYESKDDIVVMEVSSHGLAQHRVEGIEFDFCLFTNLDHEHLDYHSSMDEYFQTKQLLFSKLKPNGYSVVNTDNEWGQKLADILLSKNINVCRIGQNNNNDIRINYFDLEHSAAAITDKEASYYIFSPLAGVHNMYNMVMAFQTARLLGFKKDDLIHTSLHFEGVRGRFEMMKSYKGSTVVVDYAHTKEALYHCLSTAKHYGAKRVIHIFGFRGNRDISKRKDMLQISSKMSDQYILTFDDLNAVPEPEMLETLYHLDERYGSENGSIITDRTLAIKAAIEMSSTDDWIIITGKGHEKYQKKFFLPTENDKETVIYINNHYAKLAGLKTNIRDAETVISDFL